MLETQKLFELCEVQFRPSFNFGEGGDIAEQTEKNKGENGTEGMRSALLGAWVGHFFDTLDEVGEGIGLGHRNLVCKGNELYGYYVKKAKMYGPF